ncbi:DUF3602 domain-containing protein ASCRUDRAFT_69112 [Ascoidea rubescens DSM 1968]|uniref:Uncharacterized protein n=1 Tax=Ascoidea rubescens DSM 1968 TaxID=1344418 RepID=A0A1D2VL13_9ASCO|nr:hypothetical protein ASCRUDRAFT_69112 [Ascoidea rubescens DSM 1968]ODV62296.1 hypothetical protein ASCRUDRAFT_69112 [Ascoidea rubescens DSM 1968]
MSEEAPKFTTIGRGGAGNIVKTDSKPSSPKLIPMGSDTPHIPESQPRYTTGRGGAGNMVKNDDPDKARLAQDIEPVTSNGSGKVKLSPIKSIGRGGYGNMIDTTLSQDKQKPEKKPSLFEKIKNVFK